MHQNAKSLTANYFCPNIPAGSSQPEPTLSQNGKSFMAESVAKSRVKQALDFEVKKEECEYG